VRQRRANPASPGSALQTSSRPGVPVTVAVVGALLSSTMVSACNGGCRDFVYDLSQGVTGESTPEQALSTWASSNREGAPGGHWTASVGDSTQRRFVNGTWLVIVVHPPAGGWAVSEGTSCRG
jgi:hypothetical protein